MKSAEVILPLIAALWASGALFNTIAKDLNDKRDRILFGLMDKKRLPREHRHLLLMNDWVPHSIIALFVTSALGCVALLLPLLSENSHLALWAICTLVGLFACICGICWAWYGVREYRLMKDHIDSDRYMKLIDLPTDAE